MDRLLYTLSVSVGAIIGANIRWVLSDLIKINSIPLHTLIVNILGSFLLGIIYVYENNGLINKYWVLLLGTGFMGSLTTMSTFALEYVVLESQVKYLYLLLTIFSCTTFAYIGIFIARQFLI